MRREIAVYSILMLMAAFAFAACGGSSSGGGGGGDPWSGTVMINTASYDRPNSVAVDGDGNVYVSGSTTGDLHGHTHVGTGNDSYVAKYNPTGGHEWTAMVNTTVNDEVVGVAVDGSGNVYVAGYTEGDLHGHTSTGYDDGFIAVYNSTGGHVWTAMVNSNSDDYPYSVAVDGDGNVYMVGYTYGDLHGHINVGAGFNGFVAVYNSTGGHEWTAIQDSGAWDYTFGVAVDGGGNVYVAGGTTGDLHGHTNIGSDDGFIAVYNSTGGHVWTAMLNATGGDYFESAAVDAAGNVYAAGFYTDVSVVAMYNSTGGHVWTAMQNSTNVDYSYGVAVDGGGSVYVAGHTNGDLHGHDNIGGYDGYVVNYNSAGGHEWTAMQNTTANDYTLGVAVDGGGSVYVTGQTLGDLHGHDNIGSYDGYVVKYSSSGVLR